MLPPSSLICFNKPYGVLSQFTPEGRWRGLKDFIDLPGVYVAGRLDADSEGLLLLTNDGKLQARISDPRFKMEKTYWVQVEGEPDEAALAALRQGVMLNDGITLPARAQRIQPPEGLWERNPPVRFRQSIPDQLGGIGDPRGAQPPGAAYDGRRGLPDLAADTCSHWPPPFGQPATRSLARSIGISRIAS